MYDDEPTLDALAAIEDAALIRAHSPRFWDADTAEQVTADPYEHPSWDVHDALTGEDGWDDPAEAIEIREHLADETRLMPLADTPTHRPQVHLVDEYLTAHDSGDPDEDLLLLTLELALTEEVRAA